MGRIRRAGRAIMGVTLGRLLKWGLGAALVLAVLGVIGFALFVLWPVRSIPPLEPVDEYVYLDQGWGESRNAEARQTYYYTPQGTSLPQGSLTGALRYEWFVNLELPFSRERFAAPEHMRRYRFLVDPEDTERNPHQLPVGFTRHFNAALGEEVLDITCAACHTGQIHYTRGTTRYAIRIDGGQAMHAFTDMGRGAFAPVLVSSLISTYVNPFKFNRFARKVIGARYPQGKSELRDDLWETIKALLSVGQDNPLRHLYPVQEGYGRTDALGRIANTVFGDHLVPGNYQVAEAPVSYPYLWNIWKFDWVQYNGSVKQPLARNVGEAMGVGAVTRLLNSYGNPLPAHDRFPSSVLIPNLVTIEHTLQRLEPPRWPEEILGSIDRDLAARGETLFQDHCQGCHGPHPASAARQQARAPGKPSPDVEWRIEVIPVEHIGTDPTAANAFVERRYDLSATGLTRSEVAEVMKPLMVQHLARDARYRLQEVIDARQAQGLDVGTLPELLADYPDPNAGEPALPSATFRAIEAELGRLLQSVPDIPKLGSPPDSLQCDLDCQTVWLLWDVTRGAANIEHSLESLDLRSVSEGQGLNIIGLVIKDRFYRQYGIDEEERACIEGFGTLDLPQVVAGYKPRPLEGVWATPPFLHNGSVPTLYQMLLPPDERDVRFFVGRREFDPRHVGYVTEPLDEDEEGGFWLDTTTTGNHNTGHGFAADPETWRLHRQDPKSHPLPPGVIGPELSDDQRWAIIEYLKIHRDLPATPDDYQPPECGPWTT